jgi:hypothetical protein
VDFVELKSPTKIIPLFEQELVLPSDEVRNQKKPTPYQQIQQRWNVHRTAPKKKKDRVPTVKPNALKNKEWNMIEYSLEIFPMWVDLPEIHGTEYSDMFEPEPAEEYDLTDVPLHQQTKAAAHQMCSANMSREVTTKEFEEYVATIEDKESKKAYERWWHKFGEVLDKETNLIYWRNDLHLRFKPSATGRKQIKDGLLHGCYESYVVTKEGREQEIEVSPDWFQQNISVHQVQKDWYEEHVDNYGRKEIGFLTMQGNDTDMDNGKEKTMEYLFDERQISKIRKYKREGTIEDNDRSCILKSAASALSFLGYHRLAFISCVTIWKMAGNLNMDLNFSKIVWTCQSWRNKKEEKFNSPS